MKHINENSIRSILVLLLILSVNIVHAQSVDYKVDNKVILRIYDKMSLFYGSMPDCAFRFTPTAGEIIDIENKMFISDNRSRWRWHQCLAYVTNSSDTIYIIQRLNHRAHFHAKKIIRELWNNKQFIEFGLGDVFEENTDRYIINKRTLQRL